MSNYELVSEYLLTSSLDGGGRSAASDGRVPMISGQSGFVVGP